MIRCPLCREDFGSLEVSNGMCYNGYQSLKVFTNLTVFLLTSLFKDYSISVKTL